MPALLHNLLLNNPQNSSHATALVHKTQQLSYADLSEIVVQQASALLAVGVQKQQRVAVYLPKQVESTSVLLSISLAAGVFVPVNPVLKAPQVCHILKDCDVQVLITSVSRLNSLQNTLIDCAALQTIIVVDGKSTEPISIDGKQILNWQDFLQQAQKDDFPGLIDADMAAILYTSGSTGKPKGVVLSHQNMVTGAKSVAQYLHNQADDKILAVLPFSFDYGLSQLTTALYSGASCVLMEYLLPRDVIRSVEKHQITGLAAVPPLWIQLADLDWPQSIDQHLRYFTNSGGKMPRATLTSLRKHVPTAKPYLMYGLTEAFRSSYLPPDQVDSRPDSMGKAIPNAELKVVRADGSECAAGEPGELVHRGSLVAMGYWNDPEKTAQRFRPSPNQLDGLPLAEIAVWSGDTVYQDEEGYLFFVGRDDEMIKTSGYRVSPTEVEEVIYASKLAAEAVVLGIAHPILGQAIVVAAAAPQDQEIDSKAIIAYCKRELPSFMIPTHIECFTSLPRNPNGKIDRNAINQQLATLFNS